MLEWLLKTEVKSLAEIAEDSSEWGNYWNTGDSTKKLVETGSTKRWCVNNIYDFAGNVSEWTQEKNTNLYSVIRGGDFNHDGNIYPVACRDYSIPSNYFNNTGFRATLYIK